MKQLLIKEDMLMLVLAIILLLFGLILIGTSRFVAYQHDDIDLREKIYIPGVILFLVGAILFIGYFVN